VFQIFPDGYPISFPRAIDAKKWKISGREISLFHLLKAAYIKDARLVWWKWNRNLSKSLVM